MGAFDFVAGRAGRLDCVCPPDEGRAQEGLGRLAFGFGLSVLAQSLVLGALPVSSAATAPNAVWSGAPYALTLIGAALATFPAAYLADVFGRRGAFALGAGIGLAGGALAAWSAAHNLFFTLCLGAFWLGLSNGFALFYRHAAASGPEGGRAAALVFGGGALAAIVAPLCFQITASLAGPFADAVTLALAGLVELGAVLIAVSLPHRILAPARQETDAAPARASFVGLTIFAALAWFAMSAVMSDASSALIGCGAGSAAAGGIIAWHLLAMYLPSALLQLSPRPAPDGLIMAIGAAMLAFSVALFFGSRDLTWVSVALGSAGFGWSLANAGALRKLHGGGDVPRVWLAAHDLALLSAACAGALAGPLAARFL